MIQPSFYPQVYENVILEYVEEHGDLWPDWSEEVRLFVAYLDRTWIGKLPMTRNRGRKDPLFKFTLWNKWMEVREDIPTTNNSNEVYNNLWTIITNFIREESLSRKTLLDLASVVQTELRTLAKKNREIKVLGLKHD